MKSSELITTLSLAVTALSIPISASATQPSASAGANVSIQNNVSGKFSVGNNGSALSSAFNSEAASASVAASANNTPHFGAVNAAVSAATNTDSAGNAYNISTGTGAGSASSVGAATTAAQGAVAIHGVTSGFNGGTAETQTSNAIFAGTNQGSYVAGQTKAGFDVQLHYTQSAASMAAPDGTTGVGRSASVNIADQKIGYASGATVSGVLDGMNAAGIANIGASGKFFARAGMAASVEISTTSQGGGVPNPYPGEQGSHDHGDTPASHRNDDGYGHQEHGRKADTDGGVSKAGLHDHTDKQASGDAWEKS